MGECVWTREREMRMLMCVKCTERERGRDKNCLDANKRVCWEENNLGTFKSE